MSSNEDKLIRVGPNPMRQVSLLRRRKCHMDTETHEGRTPYGDRGRDLSATEIG